MQNNPLLEGISNLLEKYSAKLRQSGIECVVSRKYFQSSVASFEVLDGIEYHLYKHTENKKYKGQQNRYYCVIIRFSPITKNLVKKTDFKEFAFTYRKIERFHIGLEPRETISKENKILKKIEKLIQKTIQKATKKDVVIACKDNYYDLLRYVSPIKYNHKEIILGKSRSFWNTIIMIIECRNTKKCFDKPIKSALPKLNLHKFNFAYIHCNGHRQIFFENL